GIALRNMVFNSDYAVFFPESDPQVRAYMEVVQKYTSNASVFFVVSAREGDLFTPEGLDALTALTNRAWDMPGVERVDSMANYPYARWEDGRLTVSPMLPPDTVLSETERATLREAALADPVLRGR